MIALCLSVLATKVADAQQSVRLKNGIALQGLLAEIASMNKNPFAAGAKGGPQNRPILLIDDGLRRVYVHEKGMVVPNSTKDVRGLQSVFEFKQHVPLGGTAVAGLGAVYGVSRFNAFGRRAINVRGPEGGMIPIFQGITELNPRYAKLEALKDTPPYIWDMRVSTRTLDSETLRQIFRQRVPQGNLNSRLEVVRFFIECERFADAHDELADIIRVMPEAAEMRNQLIDITESQGAQLLREAKRRAEVGQPEFARQVYKGFPLAQVGRLTRLEVQDGLKKLDSTQSTIDGLIQQLKGQLPQLPANQAAALMPLVEEMDAGLSAATLPRLNDYARLGLADELALENRVSLAAAGWLLGAGSGEQNLTVVIALIKVRDLVREYLTTQDLARRAAILDELRTLEGAQAEYVSRMLPLLEPPLAWPEDSEVAPGMYQVGDPEKATGKPSYFIQLPPEYDPLREYPCVLALHPPRGKADQQLAWWTGPRDAENRAVGQAARHGYIVVAPKWTRPGQGVYEYTRREHHQVLAALRDAMRRCSIDSDRVFITGHGDGATAAWDIALSHPDIWAGMVSISGEPSKTIQHYHVNAEHVPLYFVMGELDGAPPPLFRNGPTLDKYMKVRNDVMVVMYRGRPREYFPEELPNIFAWMSSGMHKRKAMPEEIDTVTMREGDTFFWWLELDTLKPGTAIDPVLWDQAERIRGKVVSASVLAENQIRVNQGPTDRFHVWLRPGMGIDLGQRVTVRFRTRRVDLDYDGDLEVLLEDARQRADRKRPFWAKVSIP